MTDDTLGQPVTQITRLQLGGADLPEARLWARVDYAADEAHLTVVCTTRAFHWHAGARTVLSVARGDRLSEIPIVIADVAWEDEEQGRTRLRLRVVGAEPWTAAEELLTSSGSA